MPPDDSIVQAKPAKIFNKQWPDIMFANNRKAKLITLKLYETNSIITKSGAKAIGAPDGKKSESKWKPWVLIPIILIAKKANNDKPNVTTIWLVTVKLYGIIPNILQNNMNVKIVKSIGKYKEPFFFTFSESTLK